MWNYGSQIYRHVWMWGLDHKEGWSPKNWHFQNVMLEKTLESLLDSKKIKSVNPKGNQLWRFIGRTDTEAEALILCPPDTNNWFTGKDPDDGKDWGQEEKRVTEDEIVGWHHWLSGHEFEQTQRDSEVLKPGVLQFMEFQSCTWLSIWTATTIVAKCILKCLHLEHKIRFTFTF